MLIFRFFRWLLPEIKKKREKNKKRSVEKLRMSFSTLPTTLISAAKRRRFAAEKIKKQDMEGKTDQAHIKNAGRYRLL